MCWSIAQYLFIFPYRVCGSHFQESTGQISLKQVIAFGLFLEFVEKIKNIIRCILTGNVKAFMNWLWDESWLLKMLRTITAKFCLFVLMPATSSLHVYHNTAVLHHQKSSLITLHAKQQVNGRQVNRPKNSHRYSGVQWISSRRGK